jgi:zinc protease
MKRVATLGVVVSVVAASCNARATATSDNWEQTVNRAVALVGRPTVSRLPNGLGVVVQPLPEQTRVAVVVSYRVGSRDDPRGQSGLAHAIEHMTFRGSRHLNAYGAQALVDADGGRINAFTGPDTTDYIETIPSGALPQALWIESERMAFTVEQFSDAALSQERTLIEHEYGLTGTARTSLEPLLRNVMLGEGHPYARALARSLGAFKVADAKSFFQNFYRPENATVVITGGVDPSFALTQVERYFGSIFNPVTAVSHAEVPRIEPRPAHRVRFATESAEQLFAARWLMLDVTQHERYALELLATMMSLHFDRALVSTDRARSVKLDIEPHADGSLVFCVTASVKADQAMGPLEFALREEIERLWAADFSAELDALKNREMLDLVQLLQKPSMYARALAFSLSVDRAAFDMQAKVQAVRSITAADLLALRPRFQHPLFAWLMHQPHKRSSLF